jgi:hypothetical protein
MKKRQTKMMGYLAVTAGVGCASSVANAAVVFYGNASNTNIQADPGGILISASTGGVGNGIAIRFDFSRGYFTNGTDSSGTSRGSSGAYLYNGVLAFGAVSGDQNYASISFNGNDSVYEAVAQFYLDGSGGGYLMAIATLNDIPNPQDLYAVGGSALSISAGKAMIDAAAVSAVPEPSSHLALLALGAGGLTLRRRLKRAA